MHHTHLVTDVHTWRRYEHTRLQTHAHMHAPCPWQVTDVWVLLHGRAMRIRFDMSQVMVEAQDQLTVHANKQNGWRMSQM